MAEGRVKNLKTGLLTALGSLFIIGTGIMLIFVLGNNFDVSGKICFWIGIIMCVLGGISLIFALIMAFIGFKPKRPTPPKA